MKYKAYVEVKGVKIRVFPRSKTQTLFVSLEKAQRTLEQKSRRFPFNSRGYIYAVDGGKIDNHPFTIAL